MDDMIIQNTSTIEHSAVVFDFDATLVDSEPNWFRADRLLFSEYGIDLTEKMKREFIGKSLHHMVETLSSRYTIAESEEIIRDKKNRYYLDIALGNTKIFPQMKPLLSALSRNNIPYAIASGTARTVLEALLHDLNLYNDFVFFLGSEDASKGKPSPEIFLQAAKRFALEPERILVFEDSPHGVIAAKEAGMSCVAIPYLEETVNDPAFRRADLFFPDGMKSFDYTKVLEWAGW